jgi:uncharacterized repeat protein (TIGR03803 family)
MMKTILSVALVLSFFVSLCPAQTLTESIKATLTSDEGPGYTEVLQAKDGNFYGYSTSYGDFFSVSSMGKLSILVNSSNSSEVVSSLIQGPDGNFYGETNGDIEASPCYPQCGTVFQLTPTGVVTVIHLFTGGTDGAFPSGGLIVGSDGGLYGVATAAGNTQLCGGYGCGTVFRISPSGAFSVIHTFQGGSDGEGPKYGLLQASDGSLYGTTQAGGDAAECPNGSGCGTIFKIDAQGTLSTVYEFSSDDSYGEGGIASALTEGSDGGLYGAAFDQGQYGYIYRLSDGVVSDFYDGFTATTGQISGGLLVGSDQAFYGATANGVFRLTTSGDFYAYDPPDGPNGLFGYGPWLNQGSDGNFYGTAEPGTASDAMSVYEVAFSPALPAPVQIALSASSVIPGAPVKASFSVNNAFSLTMQQCYGFVTSNGVTTALGKVAGTYSSTTKLYTGSVSFNPPAGTYNYALTCGGIESGFASLYVGYPTSTTLTANPTTVSPPGSVSLQATVTRTQGSGAAGGSVSFYYQTDLLGTAKLNASGVATLSASSSGVAAGQYGVTAKYNGDASDASSTSPVVNVTVQ